MDKKTKQRSIFAVVGLLVLIAGAYSFWSYRILNEEEGEQKAAWANKDQEIITMEIRRKSLFNEILEVSGKGVCKKNSDCVAISFGPKVCKGGKRGHLYYSTLDSNPEKFGDAVLRYNRFMDEYNEMSLRIFSCVGEKNYTLCNNGACIEPK